MATSERLRSISIVVTLPAMDQHEWEAWRANAIANYAADMVRVGAWPSESAQERAVALFGRLVPNGRETPGHEFRSVMTDAGARVGAVWFAAED